MPSRLIDDWLNTENSDAHRSDSGVKRREKPRLVRGESVYILQRILSVTYKSPNLYEVTFIGYNGEEKIEMLGQDIDDRVKQHADEYFLATYYKEPSIMDEDNLFSGGVDRYKFHHEDTTR